MRTDLKKSLHDSRATLAVELSFPERVETWQHGEELAPWNAIREATTLNDLR